MLHWQKAKVDYPKVGSGSTPTGSATLSCLNDNGLLYLLIYTWESRDLWPALSASKTEVGHARQLARSTLVKYSCQWLFIFHVVVVAKSLSNGRAYQRFIFWYVVSLIVHIKDLEWFWRLWRSKHLYEICPWWVAGILLVESNVLKNQKNCLWRREGTENCALRSV